MTIRVYYSTDSGAPVYSASVGALLAVLKACLVDGYGSKVAAGWTQPFTGTNLAVFRPSAGNRHYLWVDDTNASATRVRGFTEMSGVSTGTGGFPLDGQVNGGCYVLKSNATTEPRGWVLVADEKRFWFISAFGSSTIEGSTSRGIGMFYGDIISAKAGDAYGTLLIAGETNGSTGSHIGSLATSLSTAVPGGFLARSYTQAGGSVVAGRCTDSAKSPGVTIGVAGTPYPDPVTGGILIAPLFVYEPVAQVVRGVVPGGWCPLHNLPGSPGDTFQGAGALAGKEFLLVDTGGIGGTSGRGRMALEISNTWE